MTGQTFSHYEVLERLGEGGMGVVYKARDKRLQRLVALKFLIPELTASSETLARFEVEARAISALNHPHIATIHAMEDAGERTGEAGPNRRFLVLEYLAGGTLREKIRGYQGRREPFPLSESVRIATDLAAGLAHAHRCGIIHRDIKPENVMFTGDGVLRITDFGLARSSHLSNLTRTTLTRDGATVGTAAYMAPEQARSNLTSARSDLFSLGVVIHEMLTGKRPFDGPSELATMHAVVYDPPLPLRSLRPDAPVSLEQVVLRLLEKDPAQRYQNADEVVAGLSAVSHQAGALPALESNSTAATKTMLSLDQVKVPAPSRRISAVAAVVALAALAGLVWYGLRDRTPPARANTQVAVLPFTAPSGTPDDIAFGDGLSAIVAARLASERSIWIVPDGDLRRNRVLTPDDARRVFGAPLALTGTLERPAGGIAKVTMNLVQTASGKVLKTAAATATGAGGTLQSEVMKQAMTLLDWSGGAPLAREAETKTSSAYDHYVLAKGYLQRYDQAGNLDSSVREFTEAIRLDPSYSLAYAGLGSAYWRQYRTSADPTLLERARDASIQALSRNESLAAPHITLGAIAVSVGRVDEGIRQLETASRQDPVNAEAARELAAAYVAAGKPGQAEATYRRAIQFRPDFWLGYFDLATFYNDGSRYEEAETALKKASALTPDNYLIYRNLGGVQMARGEWHDAEQSFRHALSLRPIGSVYSNLGALYIFLGRYDDAVPVLEQAVELSREQRHAYLIWGNLGDARRWTPARATDARPAYEKAIQLALTQLDATPDDAVLVSQLAVYYAKAGKLPDADRQIRRALALQPRDPAVLYRSALVYELAKKRTQSLAALNSAVSAGYSVSFIDREPELAALRSDASYPAAVAHPKEIK